MTSRLTLILLLLASHSLVAQEQPVVSSSSSSQTSDSPIPNRPALITSNPVNQVLPADSAFQLQSFAASADSILLHWDIQPGYYLYRKSITLTDSLGHPVAVTLPAGREITDEYFGTVEVYYDSLEVQARLESAIRQVQVQLEYQGCAEDLYCYPPQHKQLEFTLP